MSENTTIDMESVVKLQMMIHQNKPTREYLRQQPQQEYLANSHLEPEAPTEPV